MCPVGRATPSGRGGRRAGSWSESRRCPSPSPAHRGGPARPPPHRRSDRRRRSARARRVVSPRAPQSSVWITDTVSCTTLPSSDRCVRCFTTRDVRAVSCFFASTGSGTANVAANGRSGPGVCGRGRCPPPGSDSGSNPACGNKGSDGGTTGGIGPPLVPARTRRRSGCLHDRATTVRVTQLYGKDVLFVWSAVGVIARTDGHSRGAGFWPFPERRGRPAAPLRQALRLWMDAPEEEGLMAISAVRPGRVGSVGLAPAEAPGGMSGIVARAVRLRRSTPPTNRGVSVSKLSDLPVTTLTGGHTTLGALADGKAALVVNVASKCGLTPQYTRLEALHEELAERGFTVIGFPSNQFGGQEPGTSEEIAEFCSATYGVTFPMSDKVEVNGPGRDPIYGKLTEVADADGQAGDIQWNFEKFVLAPDGRVVARFRPRTEPDAPEVRAAIEAVLPG